MPTIQQELVTLRHSDQLLGFYWPFGFDEVMIGHVYYNPNIKNHEFDRYDKPKLYSVFEAHEIFFDLLNAGAY
jgi:hypothetical protein